MSNSERFNEWMRNTVKSVHYANNQKMSLAFEKIKEHGKSN